MSSIFSSNNIVSEQTVLNLLKDGGAIRSALILRKFDPPLKKDIIIFRLVTVTRYTEFVLTLCFFVRGKNKKQAEIRVANVSIYCSFFYINYLNLN